MFCASVCLGKEGRSESKKGDSWYVFVCILNKETEGKGRPPIFLFFFREQATSENTHLASLCFPAGLWIQMSPPLDSALVWDQQCVTDRRAEPAVALKLALAELCMEQREKSPAMV